VALPTQLMAGRVPIYNGPTAGEAPVAICLLLVLDRRDRRVQCIETP
jgi:hypothetical protein